MHVAEGWKYVLACYVFTRPCISMYDHCCRWDTEQNKSCYDPLGTRFSSGITRAELAMRCTNQIQKAQQTLRASLGDTHCCVPRAVLSPHGQHGTETTASCLSSFGSKSRWP